MDTEMDQTVLLGGGEKGEINLKHMCNVLLIIFFTTIEQNEQKENFRWGFGNAM